uniref:Uncharacterized protein n=1 Tax=Cucumis melo TaxID=3656 RepID=A0A9I9E6R2_CUCME
MFRLSLTMKLIQASSWRCFTRLSICNHQFKKRPGANKIIHHGRQ